MQLMSWPPTDAKELIARWESQGKPVIELSPGKSINSLERWFYPLHSWGDNGTSQELEVVRDVLGSVNWQKALLYHNVGGAHENNDRRSLH